MENHHKVTLSDSVNLKYGRLYNRTNNIVQYKLKDNKICLK